MKTENIPVKSHASALQLAKALFQTPLFYDRAMSDAAGYPVYRPEHVDGWIIDAGDRLDVMLESRKSVRIMIATGVTA